MYDETHLAKRKSISLYCLVGDVNVVDQTDLCSKSSAQHMYSLQCILLLLRLAMMIFHMPVEVSAVSYSEVCVAPTYF